MSILPRAITRLIDEFARLPGIGPKTASRLTFYLLRMPEEQATSLSEALRGLNTNVVTCEQCFNLSESSICAICNDQTRERSKICVVEEPLDLLAIERTNVYRGLYHVLHGAISPVDGILPQDLKIAELIQRIKHTPIQELILATNPNLEGEATASFIERQLRGHSLQITRLARGLPMGGDLEYADQQTLARALQGRLPM